LDDRATVSSAIDNVPSPRIYPTGIPNTALQLFCWQKGHLTNLVGFSRVLPRELRAEFLIKTIHSHRLTPY
jgi:hypothetical protein